MRNASLCFLLAALTACSGSSTDDMGVAPDAGVDLLVTPDGGGDAGFDSGRVDAGPHCFAIDDAGPATGYDGGAPTRMLEADLAPMRDGCTFHRGAFAEETLGTDVPLRDAIPIEHFVIFMQENRSFDSYLGTMPGVDGIPSGTALPDGHGGTVAPFHQDAYCIDDPGHGWNASHEEWNDGAMDGFVIANDGSSPGSRVMGYYDETDLPFYRDLYARFSMSDAHFCGILGPTQPNREYAMAASSHGKIDNTTPSWPTDGTEYVIMQELDHAGIPWRVYYEELPYMYGFFPGYAIPRAGNFRRLSQLAVDVACGDLPPVVWVDPGLGGSVSEHDEHPPADPQYGQRFVHDAMLTLMQSSFWSSMAIIHTYDEHGGFYDHVPPPPACPPGDVPPELTPSSAAYDFDRMGVRVPFVIVSPWSKPHYVSHVPTDHSAIPRLLEAKFGLPALTNRDANAWPMLDMLDFSTVSFPTAPTDLADATIDATHAMACGIPTP